MVLFPIQTLLANAPFQSNPIVLISPSPHHLGQSFALGHVGEYAHVLRALAPIASTSTSYKTISAL